MHTWELSKLPNIPLATFRSSIQPMLTAALVPALLSDHLTLIRSYVR